MSNHDPILNAGDAVYYTGNKFKQELFTKEGKPMKGWIHCRVAGMPRTFVVEFPEAKDGDYVLSLDVLTVRVPAKEKQAGPEIQPRRKRGNPDEET